VRTLHDPDDAADALQEAMISAFRRAADFRGDAAVTTWLHRIVVNACLDLVRRRAARPALPTDGEAMLDTLGQRAGGPDTDPTADSDTALDVGAALRILPAEQRAALVLVDMLGYSVAVAAEVLGVSPGTVKSRCARGRAKLLPYLSHLHGEEKTAGQGGNQTGAGHVSPSRAATPTVAAARPGSPGTNPPGAGQPGAGEPGAGPRDIGQPGTGQFSASSPSAADGQRISEGGGNPGHGRSS